MSTPVEIKIIVNFDAYANWDHIKQNIITAIRNELANRYRTGEISCPEVTEPLIDTCRECGTSLEKDMSKDNNPEGI